MKAERLLAALLLLQAHGKLTGRALAERLAVSGRTVHRDMEALSVAGVPVFASRGSRGGWQLDENWRTRVPGLDEAELRALLMAQPRVIGDAGLAASAERGLAKLLAAMPGPLRERAVSMRQRLYVDATGWRGPAQNLSVLPLVQDAVSRDRTLMIRYRQAGPERVERTIHPRGLVAKGTTWYLVATTPKGFRTYRVSRIEEATVLETRFERPVNFDLETYWQASTEQFRLRQQYVATLRLAPRAADSLRMWYRVQPGPTDGRRDPDGWVTLRVQFDDEEGACFVVLGLGPVVDVIEPASLQARVQAAVAATVERMHDRNRRRRRR